MSLTHQPAVLATPAAHGRSITLRRLVEADPRAASRRLVEGLPAEWAAIGIGAPLVRALGREIVGLRPFPSLAAEVDIPVTQGDVWIALRGESRSEVFDRAAVLDRSIAGGFEIADAMDTFLHHGGLDLTGYEDGTANPSGEEAIAVAICGAEDALPSSSFVAVQRWRHDLARFERHDRATCDAIIGRRFEDNEEIDDAPESSHVKRTAQELYEPEAFMMRRSTPYATPQECGLEFVSYCRTLDAFERMLIHMAGLDDGIVDALFGFSRPVTGGYYWCPPLRDGHFDLTALGL
ncbi:MAG: Dyp-type peroxidase [Siculibacillus sp.]|nr:Dyp-type peroxidase [Siculibacillus sp.]